MKLPPDSLSLAIAAFRAWETPERVANIPLRINATSWDVTAERPKAAGDRYGWSATEFNRESVQFTTKWTSIWVDPPSEKIAWAESPDEQIITKALWDLLDVDGSFDSNAVYDINRKARSLWNEIATGLTAKLLEREVIAYALEGSPVANRFIMIPAAAWHHYSIDDWEAGTAIADDGQRLFDIRVAGPARPAGRPGVVESVTQAICEIYPDGKYPSNKIMMKAIASHLGMAGIAPRTFSRAKQAAEARP